jgi:hypothetical protein
MLFCRRRRPPQLDYDEGLVLLLSRADAALSELSGLGRYLPNPHVLIAPYVRAGRTWGRVYLAREVLRVMEGAGQTLPTGDSRSG